MKKLLTLAVFLVAIAGFADDSPLVKAAKASGGPKKKATKKTITNADVKKTAVKASGPAPSTTTAPAPAAPPASPLAEQAKLFHAPADAQKRADTAQTKVSELDKE